MPDTGMSTLESCAGPGCSAPEANSVSGHIQNIAALPAASNCHAERTLHA